MILILYQQELFKKISHLGTFCTQSVNKGLRTLNCSISSVVYRQRQKECNEHLDA
jgi:hypothetical protein